MKWLGIMLMAMLLVAVPGYGEAQTQGKGTPPPAAQPNGPEVKQAPARAESYTPEARKEYEKEAAKKLEALKQQIHDLNVKAHTAAPQIKRSMLRATVSLNRQVMVAQKKLTDLQKAAQKDWGALKAEMDKALDSLKKSYDNVESRLH